LHAARGFRLEKASVERLDLHTDLVAIGECDNSRRQIRSDGANTARDCSVVAVECLGGRLATRFFAGFPRDDWEC
jgi:hypothetical protein